MDELTMFSTVDDYSDVSVLSIILYMCCLSVCLLGRLSSFLFLCVCERAFQPCVCVCCVDTLVSRQQAPMFCFPVMHPVAADRPSSCCSPPRPGSLITAFSFFFPNIFFSNTGCLEAKEKQDKKQNANQGSDLQFVSKFWKFLSGAC